jgi:hypothetical protein
MYGYHRANKGKIKVINVNPSQEIFTWPHCSIAKHPLKPNALNDMTVYVLFG